MGIGSEEKLSNIRIIDTFEEILPYPGAETKLGNNLIALAKGYGLNNMRDVVAEWIDFGKNTSLAEIKDSKGEVIGYRPEINVEVTFDNSLEIQRKLAASMILSFAVLTNNRFKIHWDSVYEKEGIFGSTWADGYLTISRQNTPPGVYIDLIKICSDKEKEVQDWHLNQIDLVKQGLDTLKDATAEKKVITR